MSLGVFCATCGNEAEGWMLACLVCGRPVCERCITPANDYLGGPRWPSTWTCRDCTANLVKECGPVDLPLYQRKRLGLEPPIKTKGKRKMPLNVSKKVGEPTGQAGKLLHGSDVPTDTKMVTAVVKKWREAPDGFNSPVIADFAEPVYGCAGMAINKTNLKNLVAHVGTELPDNCTVTFAVVLAHNPKTDKDVRSFSIVSAGVQDAKTKRASR